MWPNNQQDHTSIAPSVPWHQRDSIFMNLLLVPIVHHLNFNGKVYVDDFLLERGFFSVRGHIKITNGEAMSCVTGSMLDYSDGTSDVQVGRSMCV